jgi:hypothetical protein
MKNQYNNNSFERKENPFQSIQIHIILLYSNHLLLLLIITLVGKSFSTSYKEPPSATRIVEESMNREQHKTPSSRFCRCFSLFVFVCVSDNNNNQRLRMTTTYHVILSSTISSLLLMIDILIASKE